MVMGKEVETQLMSDLFKAFSDISSDMEEDDLKQMGYILHVWKRGLASNSSTRRMHKKLRQFLDELISTKEESVKQFAIYATDVLKKLK